MRTGITGLHKDGATPPPLKCFGFWLDFSIVHTPEGKPNLERHDVGISEGARKCVSRAVPVETACPKTDILKPYIPSFVFFRTSDRSSQSLRLQCGSTSPDSNDCNNCKNNDDDDDGNKKKKNSNNSNKHSDKHDNHSYHDNNSSNNNSNNNIKTSSNNDSNSCHGHNINNKNSNKTNNDQEGARLTP